MLEILKKVINFFIHPDEQTKDTKVEQFMNFWSLSFKKESMEQQYLDKEKYRTVILFRIQFLLHIFINFTYFINNQFFLKNYEVAYYRIGFSAWHLILMLLQTMICKIPYQKFISISELLSVFIGAMINLQYIQDQLLGKDCKQSTITQSINSGMWTGLIAMSYILVCPNWIAQSLMLSGTVLFVVGMLGNLGSIYWTFYFLLFIMTIFFRLLEYHRRLDFYLIWQQTSNLHACKNIFDKTVPSSILIVSEDKTSLDPNMKLLYCNDFAKKYLKANSDVDIFEKMKYIYVQQDESELQEVVDKINIYDVLLDKISIVDEWQLIKTKSQSLILKNEYDISDQSDYYLCMKLGSSTLVEIPAGLNNVKSHFEIRILPCLWESQISFLVIMNDISEKVRLKHMKELDQYKDRLLATVSHDLKTPLNGMILDISIMQNILVDKSQVTKQQIQELCNHLDEFNQNGQLLLSMINDLLDYSQINKGQLRLTPRLFNIISTFKFINQLLIRQTKEKGVQLIFNNYIPQKYQKLNNDENRLKQVLINLVANAIKFTIQGSITVNSHYEEYQDLILIEVIDTGYGIPENIQKNLFRLYSTFDLGHNNRHGVGLGLTISQQLVNVLGPTQKIELSSEVGKGSTFKFKIYRQMLEYDDSSIMEMDKSLKQSIPMFPQVSQKNLNLITQNNSDKHRKSKTYFQLLDSSINESLIKHILIVDDTPFNIIALSAMVNKVANCKIYKAFNGVQALEVIKNQEMDIIFMDVNMPEMDGYQCTQEIRKSEALNSKRSTVIVIVTAFTSAEDKNRSSKCGANDHLDKPLNLEDLKYILRKYELLDK